MVKTKIRSVLSAAFVCVLLATPVLAQIRGPVEVTAAAQHDTSEDVRNNPPLPVEAGQALKPVYHVPQSLAPAQPDPVVQTQPAAATAPQSVSNFDGVGAGFSGPQGTFSVNSAPPDTVAAVGATQYVQWVNTSFAVFDKTTGAAVYGPASGRTLWAGFGGKCETGNDGDPIVQYDKAANRWIMTQFAVAGGAPYYQCVAISTTSDATGSYYRYAFQQPYFNDYPKVGVWSDAYYVTFNLFNGNSFVGPRVCAWDRNNMLNGAAATQQCFQLTSSSGSLLPADLDGSTPPPAGSPEYVLSYGSNSLILWKFHVDFANSANTTLTGPVNIAVAPFTRACNGGTCIPQLGTMQLLDSLADRLMYRLAYRNFGDHEALVVNHSVATTNAVGVRWYELRNPGGTPVVYQQGTYAPDASYRWMGSIGMDKSGDIAVGYSVSSTTLNPSISYTGRAPGDPLGTLAPETSIIVGTGSQTTGLSRWGDYSSMTIDPVDDCTFWYSTEYLKANGTFNWSTRIASFRFPTCGNTNPDFSLSASPWSQTVTQGSPASYSATVSALLGFSGTVNLSVSGLPQDAGVSFSPPTVTDSGSSTLTVTTASTTPAGTYTLTISGVSGAITHSTTVTLVVNAVVPPPVGDFTISAAPTSQTIPRGTTANYTLSVTPSGGFNGNVALSVSGLPKGATASFSSSSTLSITTNKGAAGTGTSILTITGTSGTLVRSTTVSLTVK